LVFFTFCFLIIGGGYKFSSFSNLEFGGGIINVANSGAAVTLLLLFIFLLDTGGGLFDYPTIGSLEEC